ncbi:MAG: hypothetical protein AAFY60_05005 [Myxococcota bacterium]
MTSPRPVVSLTEPETAKVIPTAPVKLEPVETKTLPPPPPPPPPAYEPPNYSTPGFQSSPPPWSEGDEPADTEDDDGEESPLS